MNRSWLLCCVLILVGLRFDACSQGEEAGDGASVPSVGYIDPFGGWYLRSLFPLFRSKLNEAGIKALKEAMPHADLTEFEQDPDIDKISDVFTVGTIVRFVEAKLAAS